MLSLLNGVVWMNDVMLIGWKLKVSVVLKKLVMLGCVLVVVLLSR